MAAASINVTALLLDLLPATGQPLGLKVGIWEGATHTRADSPGMIPVAEYAMHNEYGTSRIPARPFLRTSVDIYGQAWADELADRINEGQQAKDALAAVGSMAVADIRSTIEQWETPPNAPATIKRKRSGRDNPLVDSGDMLDAVSFEVTGGGAE